MRTLILAVLLLSTSVVAQTPYSETVEVRLHNVDVIVTDAAGNHAGGLRAEDFEIFEDGKPQAVTNFAEYADRRAVPSAGAGAQVPPPRKFAIFIDDMVIHPYTRRKFSKSVSDLIDRAMRANDEAAVLMPASPDKVKLEFTTDHEAVRARIAAAMDASRFRTDDPLALERRAYAIDAAGAGGGTRTSATYLARRQAERIRERVEQRLGNLRALVSALAGQEGRKVIVLVADSLPSMPGQELFRFLHSATSTPRATPAAFNAALQNSVRYYMDLTPMLDEIARSASANGVTIYCLQPDLGIAPQVRGDIADTGDSESESEVPTNDFQAIDALRNTERTMDLLTEKTGGKWFRGDSRVDDAFRQVELDVTSYYSMAYRAEGSLDRPHHIEVRVKGRPELSVRARNEVVRRSIRNEVTERVVAGLVEKETKNELGIELHAGAIDRHRREATANVDVLVPLAKLTFLPDGDKQRASFTVHYAASGEDVDFVSGVEPEQIVEIPAAEFEQARHKHWRYTLAMKMRKGAHRVGVGVLDGTSQEWGWRR